MEKLPNRYNKEYMKMAMLKHEETFREQVCELHRLYQIQKLLMKNVARNMKQGPAQSSKWNFKNSRNSNPMIDLHQEIYKRPRKCLDLERPAEDYIEGKEENGMIETEDDGSELELTLGPTIEGRRRKTLSENPLPSDSGASFSSSSTESSHIERPSSGSNNHLRTYTREELTGLKWVGIDMPTSTPAGFLGGRKNSSNVEEQFRQDNNPPWLFQALSLKTT